MLTMIRNRSSLGSSSRMLSIAKSTAAGSNKINRISPKPLLRCSQQQTKKSFHATTRPALALVQEKPFDYGHGTDVDSRFRGNQPTLEYAKAMPNKFSAMRHEQILQLCVEGSFKARTEALIRNVMAVDSIEYEEAEQVVVAIGHENQKGMVHAYLPYKTGMAVSIFAGCVSFPMIFDLSTVQQFNEMFVTTELPPLEDLETYLEVGSASWAWMEPIIGQTSFVLLLLQFARNQALNLGIKPYGDWVKRSRSARLMAVYPQYDEVFVTWFSEGQSLYGSKIMD